MTFTEKWLNKVGDTGSTLCAGLDPAVFEMGRGEKGLPKESSEKDARRDWCLRYLEAVAPFCAAVKPNVQYWKDPEGAALLDELCGVARDLGLLVVEDAKLADIGATNDAGIFTAMSRAHAITIAPFAGNLEETVKNAKKRDPEFGIITMCLMSNPEYGKVKHSLVPLSEDSETPLVNAASDDSGDTLEDTVPGVADDAKRGDLQRDDILECAGKQYLPWYLHQAWRAGKSGCDGIVVGAPSRENHIQEKEIRKIAQYLKEDQVVLCPGVGAQGGAPESLFRVFHRKRVMVNVGRGLMFPRGSLSTAEEQAEAARYYRQMLKADN